MAGSSPTSPDGTESTSTSTYTYSKPSLTLLDLPLGPAKLVSEFLPLEEPVTCGELISLLTLYPIPFLRFVIRDDYYDAETAAEFERALQSVTLRHIHELTVNISTVEAVGLVRFLLHCSTIHTLFLCIRGQQLPILTALVPHFIQSTNTFHGIYACPHYDLDIDNANDNDNNNPSKSSSSIRMTQCVVDILTGDEKLMYFDIGMYDCDLPKAQTLQQLLTKRLVKHNRLKHLKYLTLRTGSDYVADLVQVLRDTEVSQLQLRFLCIEDTNLSMRTAKALADFLRDSQCKLEALELLQLSGAVEAFVTVLDALVVNLRVNELALSCLDLCGKGTFALGRLLETSTILRKLQVSSVAFGLDGVEHIMRGLEKNRSIKYLSLQGPIVDFTDIRQANGSGEKLEQWRDFKDGLWTSRRFMEYKPFDFDHFTYRRSYHYYETARESRTLSRMGCYSLANYM